MQCWLRSWSEVDTVNKWKVSTSNMKHVYVVLRSDILYNFSSLVTKVKYPIGYEI